MTASDSTGLRFDPQTGIIPAVVQDARSGRVLMLGYMNREALATTRQTGRVTFYSRSRRALWTKGATSGNWLELVEIRPDCDRDALLVRAVAHGPTCHTGDATCFGAPDRPTLGEVLGELFELVESRKRERPPGSYTTRLFEQGTGRIAQKVAEEAVELALEAAASGDGIAEEAADLLYHVLVLLSHVGVSPETVAATLAARRPRLQCNGGYVG
jgi:phosphoribosyl-ATP pyrophosphohydrolase/phosphoribosyl-AMP cyclohydrolase